MAQWRVLDFQKYEGPIAARQGKLFAGERSVPLADISTILTGPRCSLHASLLDRAAHFEIILLACDWRGVPISAALPWSSNTRVGARHAAQSQLSEGRRKNAWMQLVKAKIAGQRANLHPESAAYRSLQRLQQEVRSGDPSNTEAQAAKLYWKSVFLDEPGFVRDAAMSTDRNALLNYGYTILRGAVIRNIVAAGLWPTLGFWHHHRGNVFALADDLIEPFRPVVDHVVQGFSIDTELGDLGVRASLVASLDMPFATNGHTVGTMIMELAQTVGAYVEGEGTRLQVSSWRVA
ncbi:type II CRISPR-associated endonuclease Cas1 [Pseudoclavibacter sp. CFCC 11306]|uniref:type II CRISPR-associated endonuclease Cas1 n=1 Tax=Pseudoclavibacter sp. CFCC 11306 TaxID=1564493 RepID=UPI0017887568|nr:type II CRISPR-associated endonuclease Cas1 [Pseudoclavibacter sp. CFCC 11306]